MAHKMKSNTTFELKFIRIAYSDRQFQIYEQKKILSLPLKFYIFFYISLRWFVRFVTSWKRASHIISYSLIRSIYVFRWDCMCLCACVTVSCRVIRWTEKKSYYFFVVRLLLLLLITFLFVFSFQKCSYFDPHSMYKMGKFSYIS